MEFQVAENDLCQVTSTVWETVLGMSLTATPPGGPHPDALTGCVRISGGWEGTIALQSSPAFARRAAVALLGTEPAETTQEEINDAFGELINIIGGNIKGMLPGPSQLSIPFVQMDTQCEGAVPGATVMLKADFECEGEPVRVAMLSPAAQA